MYCSDERGTRLSHPPGQGARVARGTGLCGAQARGSGREIQQPDTLCVEFLTSLEQIMHHCAPRGSQPRRTEYLVAVGAGVDSLEVSDGVSTVSSEGIPLSPGGLYRDRRPIPPRELLRRHAVECAPDSPQRVSERLPWPARGPLVVFLFRSGTVEGGHLWDSGPAVARRVPNSRQAPLRGSGERTFCACVEEEKRRSSFLADNKNRTVLLHGEMAARAASQAAMLSAPAAAPISSKSLSEAKARAHSFYRQVRRRGY